MLEKLITYINERLATDGLTLSQYGKDEVAKRFKLPESQGGYSNYWKQPTQSN
jgi:hypothetical protein